MTEGYIGKGKEMVEEESLQGRECGQREKRW